MGFRQGLTEPELHRKLLPDTLLNSLSAREIRHFLSRFRFSFSGSSAVSSVFSLFIHSLLYIMYRSITDDTRRN
jgi:hypothetical protein